MYVLVDIEWYEGNNFAFLTQLAGCRVDAACTVTNQFYSLIAPLVSPSSDRIDWNHVAFGYRKKADFLYADSVSEVIDRFQRWLQPDDILVFWHEESEKVFRVNFQQRQYADYDTRIIGHHVRNCLPSKNKSGSPARLCKRNGFPLQSPEHNASVDVNNLLSLLSSVNFPLQLLDRKDWSNRLNEWLSCSFQGFESTSPKLHRLMSNQYCVDHKTHLVHLVGCPEIPEGHRVTNTKIKKAIEKNLTPCSCCYKNLETYVFSHAATPPKSALVYSDASEHAVVHHANCSVVKRIDPQHRKKFHSAAEAEMKGYHFCKICSSVEKYIRPIKRYVDGYCSANRLKYYVKDNTMHISSLYDKWQVILDPDNGQPTLFHKNKGKHRHPLSETCIPNYHLQENVPHHIPGILKAIVNHDRYKGSLPVIQKPKGPAKKKAEAKVPRSKREKQAGILRKQKTERSRMAEMWTSYDDWDQEYYGV